ncbi:hypothetical protein [Streptomyces umbrinus]|uniref:hypothetical protein n=1 Tax=Streptomyces umbrinus TaxID=67370 RepID=UPI003C2C3C11
MSVRRQIIAALSEDSLGGFATLHDVEHAEQLVDAYRTEVLAEAEEKTTPTTGPEVTPELVRLRIFAEATTRRHEEIRARLAQVQLAVNPDAWDLGMAVLAILDGPPTPTTTRKGGA